MLSYLRVTFYTVICIYLSCRLKYDKQPHKTILHLFIMMGLKHVTRTSNFNRGTSAIWKYQTLGGQDADLQFKSMVFHRLLVTRTTTTCEID